MAFKIIGGQRLTETFTTAFSTTVSKFVVEAARQKPAAFHSLSNISAMPSSLILTASHPGMICPSRR
jgi:formylmethanofuran:tetrahydromethanopterin formyltransferase